MQLDHVNIRTAHPEKSIDFYRNLIGLRVGYRPDFSFPGYWLYHEERPIVHLNVAENGANPASGSLDHVAFYTDDFDGVLARILEMQLPHKLLTLPDGTRRQCFLRDPDGVRVEISGP